MTVSLEGSLSNWTFERAACEIEFSKTLSWKKLIDEVVDYMKYKSDRIVVTDNGKVLARFYNKYDLRLFLVINGIVLKD